MGKDHGRREAEQQARQRDLEAARARETASQPTPLQARMEADDLQFLNDINSPDFDITKTKAMNPYLSLYQASTAANEGDYGGQGLLSMGASGSAAAPGLAMLIKQNRADRRKQVAGGALENAFRMKNAEVAGSALPLINLDVNRNLSLAGMQNQNAQNAWANYFRIRGMPSAWEQMRDSFAQGAGMAARGGG